MPQSTRYRRYNVPRGDGEVLIDPPTSEFRQLVDAARDRRRDHADLDIGGRSLGELCRSARQSFVTAALDYTTSYRDASPALRERCHNASDVPLLVTGHQAELFHPGVWFKNFVLDKSSRELGGIGIHLVIDTDDCRSPSIRVPTGSVDEPLVETIAFDEAALPQPYELRRVVDAATVQSFADRVENSLHPLITNPLVRRLWKEVNTQLDACNGRIGWAVARGRHRLEECWGLDTLEIPQSLVCALPEVGWLTAYLLCELPRFTQDYNAALRRYRAVHQLRSAAQPMPNLATRAEWLESPFWVYTPARRERRPLYVRSVSDGIELSDRSGWSAISSANVAQMAECLAALERDDVFIRTRALSTTLIARLLLGDLFLHGIGGAKYDEVTTEFATEFFGFSPASYSAISATVSPPIEHTPITKRDITAVDQTLRDMRYHPENYIARHSRFLLELEQTKRLSVHMPKASPSDMERHQIIDVANLEMWESLEREVRELQKRREQLERQERATRILDSREYAFCLYPEDYLRERMSGLLTKL